MGIGASLIDPDRKRKVLLWYRRGLLLPANHRVRELERAFLHAFRIEPPSAPKILYLREEPEGVLGIAAPGLSTAR